MSGGHASVFTADAPGRVNLIGEHTDYNAGFVLPIATPQRTRVTLRPRPDGIVRATSSRYSGAAPEYRVGEERRTGGFVDYVQGVTWALARWDRKPSGFDLHVESDVPVGAGLSSSAALEVAVLRALRAAGDAALDDLEIARVAHEAETGFVGVPVGIMDQLAASLATAEEALFVDVRSLAIERVPLPDGTELAVVDSGVPHEHQSGGYRTRRAECDAAAKLLGVTTLRDASPLLDRAAALPPPLNLRARHVITENARVLSAVAAMRAADPEVLGRLFYASHESLRDDFAVSVDAVNQLVDAARTLPHVYGARLTGGGFGGSVVVLCAEPWAATVGERLAQRVAGARLVIPAAHRLGAGA